MQPIDIVLVAVWLVVAYVVAGEGCFRAAATLLATLFAGLTAMNFFEPLAEFLIEKLPAASAWADVASLAGLFVAGCLILRSAAARAARDYIHLHPLVEELGRWGCGALAGYVAMAFLLTAAQTAPLPREFIGFRPERKNLFDVAAPDRQWLGFTQHVSERVFPRTEQVPDGRGGFVEALRLFDGPYREVPGETTHHWPSFPMRYADWRETLRR